MKRKHKLMLLVPFLFSSTLFSMAPITPAHADTVTLSKPTLYINDKGKVSVESSKGKVKKKETLMTDFITKYRVIIAGVSGVGAVSMILFFILGFIRLGATSSNPDARSKTIMGLVASGVAAAGLGVVAFITGIFLNAL